MRLFRILTTLCFALCVATGYATQLPPDIVKSEVIVFINGQKFYVHTVKGGETLYSIAKAYEVSEDVIKEHNRGLGETLNIDQTLKIPYTEKKAEKRKKRDFIQHKVSQGETFYAIARKYEISVQVLREDNPDVDPQTMSIDQVIWVRKADMGESTEEQAQEQISEYAEQLTIAANDGYKYHVVQAGETVYSLSRQFGISEEEFYALNDVKEGLKQGAMVRYPAPEEPKAAEQPVIEEQKRPTMTANGENMLFEALTSEEELKIALMLPLNVKGKINSSFVEFYQGFLLGLEDLKAAGHKTHLTLYNTRHDALRVEEIVGSAEFEGTNLIVGPVYEDELSPVLRYAHENGVPVVSPLANIEVEMSPALYQLAPKKSEKYRKIADLLDGGKDIYLIYAAENDTEFEGEMMELLRGKEYMSYTYSYDKKSIFKPKSPNATPLEDVAEILKRDKQSLFIVMAKNEIDVDRILGTISSARFSISERGMRNSLHTVLGSSRWSRFNNIDPSTFFRNNVVMISTYHAKRNARVVREFDGRFIEAYKTLPSLYAYRGYDTAMIFGEGMRQDIMYNMLDRRYIPLQTSYKFTQSQPGGTFFNQEWVRVNYNTNFKLTIE